MTAMVFALLVTSLGMVVPSTPGYIGVFHGLVVLTLAPFGVPTTTAMSIALVWHAVNYIVLSWIGPDHACEARHVVRPGCGKVAQSFDDNGDPERSPRPRRSESRCVF